MLYTMNPFSFDYIFRYQSIFCKITNESNIQYQS